MPAGSLVTATFLSKDSHPSKIARVIALTRDASSKKAEHLKSLGAEVVEASDKTISASQLAGVDVLINTMAYMVSLETRNAYAKAAAEAGVRVYLPNEFGV